MFVNRNKQAVAFPALPTRVRRRRSGAGRVGVRVFCRATMLAGRPPKTCELKPHRNPRIPTAGSLFLATRLRLRIPTDSFHLTCSRGIITVQTPVGVEQGTKAVISTNFGAHFARRINNLPTGFWALDNLKRVFQHPRLLASVDTNFPAGKASPPCISSVNGVRTVNACRNAPLF
jgi:hypothetical protein